MAAAVYLLCALTSILCAVMLLKAFRKSKARLLFWTCIGFAGIAINNILLVVDMIVFPEITTILDWRTLPAVICMTIMIYGLIIEEV